jgi:hypothetical protein
MREFLAKMIGKELDVLCGGAYKLRGKVVKVEGGVLQLRDDQKQSCYVAVDHVVAVWEVREDKEQRPGFVSHPK